MHLLDAGLRLPSLHFPASAQTKRFVLTKWIVVPVAGDMSLQTEIFAELIAHKKKRIRKGFGVRANVLPFA